MSHHKALALAAALLLAPLSAWPVFDPVNDDTDIFLVNPTFSATRPNVMIFVDNTANWSQSAGTGTKYDGVRAALSAVLTTIVNDSYNIGFSMFVETGGQASNADGAYLRYGIRQMTGDATDANTNKGKLIAQINALDQNGDKGNNATFSLAMAEMFNYFAGRQTYSGHGKTKTDAGNSVYVTAGTPLRQLLAGSPLPAGADTSSVASTYTSPIVDGCQKNFIIFISNGEANDNSSSIAQASSLYLQQTGTSPGTIALSPSGSEGIIADEYARYMANSDCNSTLDGVQNVYTYTLDVLPKSSGQGPAHTALLKSMAANGKGKYFAIIDMNTTSQLELALTTILQEVQAVNSTFASTTLPVSVNVRGTHLNQVYIGVFRPDANRSPRWLGNLKLYKLGVESSTQTLFLADANGAAAENAATGFITGSAVSFWTQPSTYWDFRSDELNGVGLASDSPDGELVEKGGAGQRVRADYPSSQATRRLYTCVNASFDGLCAANDSLSSIPFDNTRVSAADLGAFTTYNVTSLTASGTTATLTLGAAPSPGWALADQIKIEGASPDAFNGIYALTSANNSTLTYSYTLPLAPSASGAQASASAHGLQTGDLVTISGAGAFDVSDAAITRLGPDSFQYSAASASGSFGATTASGKKSVTSLSGSGNLATAVVGAHGYSSGATITISGANETAFNKTASITVIDANSFTYSTSPDVISGTTNTARVTANGHNLASGQSVYIVENSNASYNGGPKALTKLDSNTFTFASTEPLSGAGGVAGLRVTNFSHPTSGPAAGRDVLTVTTESAHNITGTQIPFSVTIAGGSGGFAVYNGTWTVTAAADILNATQFRIRNSSFDSGSLGVPAGTVVAGKPIASIDPIVSASGTIRAARSIAVQSITALTNATGAMTAGRLSDGDNGLRDAILAWVRGADNREDENPQTTPANSDIRPSVHGDVLHSRPAVVNYNRYGDDNDIYAFYGGNDGIFRALKGGISVHASGPDVTILPGSERWGFIPREFFGKLKRLRERSPIISNANQKDYFADGSVAVYQKDANADGKLVAADGDQVLLFITMRRGGNFVYALDVSDPADPRLLWRRGSADPGWGEVGQTWSEPKVVRVNASIGNAANPDNWVLVFGAGYDEAVEDINPCLLQASGSTSVTIKPIGAGTITYTSAGSCTITGATGGTTTVPRTRGRGILVVDAFTGAVVWQAGPAPAGAARNLTVPTMTCAIPSDVSVVDMNRPSSTVERAYVGDTCGNVWRVDLKDADPDNWAVTRIAEASSADPIDIAGKRKFLFPPDLVFGVDTSTYTAVLLGSGDREHPFDSTVQNAFYMFKDRDYVSDASYPKAGALNGTSKRIAGYAAPGPTGNPITDADLFNATNQFVDSTSSPSLNGWKINLASGEKVISSATTVSGTTFFNTNQPSATAGGGACGSNLGIAREYLVGFADASATADINASGDLTLADRSMIHAGGGYLPSPVPVVVEIDAKRYQGVISGTSVKTPPGLTLEARTRAYWYKEIE